MIDESQRRGLFIRSISVLLVMGAAMAAGVPGAVAHAAEFPPPPSFTPTLEIGYEWNGTTVEDGGTYDFPPDGLGYGRYLWPGTPIPNNAWGIPFKGSLHAMEAEVNSHSLGRNGDSLQPNDNLKGLGTYTVVIFESTFHNIFNDPIHLYIDWFQNGTSTGTNVYPDARPPNQWGYLTFTVEDPDVCTENCFSNVAFIPGIKATELYEGDSLRWLPGAFNFDAPRLEMTPSGESVNNITVGEPIENAYGIFEIYDSFLDFLDGLKAGDTISDWKSLPYDWRYDVYDVVVNDQSLRDGSLLNLANEIRTLASTSKNGKVTIIAHSNGGLVAKALIEALGSDAALVDRLVMVGTPQLGTPSTVPAMLHGYEEALPAEFPAISMTKSTARSVMENMLGAYGLLPLAEYFNVISNPMVEFDNSALTADFRNAYDNTIDTAAELQSFLLGVGDGRAKPPSGDTLTPNVLNSALLSDSLATRNALESWAPPSGLEVIQLAGWGLDTMYGFRYEEALCVVGAGCTTFLDLVPLMTVEGDKTVVTPSAKAQAESSSYLFNMSAYNRDNGKAWQHANILAAIPVQDLIQDIITGAGRSAAYISTTTPATADASKRLRLSVHSPITIGIRDSLGRFTGAIPNPDPLSDIPLVAEEIPNSYYMEFGEGKYIGFEANEEYTIVMQGTDDGTFTLKVEEVHADVVTETIIYSNVPVSITTTAELRIQDIANKSALEIDEDGDGTIDETVEPDSEEKTPHEQLDAFRDAVAGLDVHKSIKKHLTARSFAIEKALEKNKKNSIKRAQNIVSQMERYIRARTDKRRGILPTDARVLIDMLMEVRQGL